MRLVIRKSKSVVYWHRVRLRKLKIRIRSFVLPEFCLGTRTVFRLSVKCLHALDKMLPVSLGASFFLSGSLRRIREYARPRKANNRETRNLTV